MELEWNSTLRNVLLGSSLLGVTGGVVGTFAVLRRQSLLGDALAHAALPGVCVAFLLTGAKSPASLFAGALAAGVLGAFVILLIVRGSKVKEDSAIGIVLSVFFGMGIVLLTYIQRLPGGHQSGLNTYLFGQAATLLEDDIVVMAVVGSLVLAVVFVFFKEFKLLAFDREFGESLGYPMRWIEVLLTGLLVVVVVLGLQTVGVVLMVATLVTPAAAARQWVRGLGALLIVSASIGAFSGAVGAVASSVIAHLPTGPTIVIVSSAVLGLSLLFAPERGFLWSSLRNRRLRNRIRRENLLSDVYRFGERRAAPEAWVSRQELQLARGQRQIELGPLLRRLERGGLLESSGPEWRLTPAGFFEANSIVRKHRLWEVYLTRRLDLPSDHVHRDAEAMEHALTDEAVRDLESALGYPKFDPHGRPIPGAQDSVLEGQGAVPQDQGREETQ